ncbi:MAG: hypothetical protein JXA94_07515 [Parachlamydiales bacterium]|nr:hypothetical protein [Parachlamydiales bacterium]
MKKTSFFLIIVFLLIFVFYFYGRSCNRKKLNIDKEPIKPTEKIFEKKQIPSAKPIDEEKKSTSIEKPKVKEEKKSTNSFKIITEKNEFPLEKSLNDKSDQKNQDKESFDKTNEDQEQSSADKAFDSEIKSSENQQTEPKQPNETTNEKNDTDQKDFPLEESSLQKQSSSDEDDDEKSTDNMDSQSHFEDEEKPILDQKTQDENYQEDQTNKEDATPSNDQDAVLLNSAKGLIIAANEKELAYIEKQDVKGLEVIGLNVPGGFEKLKNYLEPLFLNKQIKKSDIENLKIAIIEYYTKNDYPLITIYVPSQDITDSVISFILREGKLAEVKIYGNKWTAKSIIKNKIKAKIGQPINEKKIERSLYYLNLNPFRKIDLIYSHGEKEGTTDLELLTFDRFPLRAYVGSDNTGIKTTERNRWFSGFIWNNAFAIDSILSYQYTAAYDIKKFQAHTAKWEFFLPWLNTLTLFGGYSQVDVKHINPTITENKGFSSQASIRYDILLPMLSFITHNFIFGSDFKRTDTNLTFSEIFAVDPQTVNLTQLLFSYNLNYDKGGYKSNFLVEMYWSPGKWLSQMEDERYNHLRTFSENKYFYTRAYFNNLFRLPEDILFSLTFRGQVSNKNLLPSEMLGIGGYDSVRGYYERELNADLGLLINAELRSPAFKLIRQLKNRKEHDGLQFIAFFDYGLASVYKKLPLEDKTRYLIGFGPGLRYALSPYLSARLDWGFKGKHNPEYSGGNSILHFSVNIGY